jgi:hypothetical protein
MEICYKLHSFPPGFKFTKGKVVGEPFGNQVSEFSGTQDASSLPFTQEQCQKLMALINPNSEISSANQVGQSQNHLITNM